MIAISLLAIALTTLFGSQSQSVSLGGEVQFNTQAPLLAQLKLAELTTTGEGPASDSGDFGEEFPDYQWTVESEEVNLEASTILSKLEDIPQRLTLTVSSDNGRFTYQLQSYLRKETP